MKKFLLIASVSLITLFSQSCFSKKTTVTTPQYCNINLTLLNEPQNNKYINLDYGIRLYVKDQRSNTTVLQKYDASAISVPPSRVSPEVVSFVTESTKRYMRVMGFNLDADVSTDYLMTMTITDFNVNYLSGVGWSSTVKMNIQVQDNNRTLVYPNVVVTGRASESNSSTNFETASRVMNKAYENALKDIDWDRIAFFLDKSDSPALEKNKQVTGEGNTALESTVIRWFIDSSPRGADISWRVVSSTPDVKNTNQNYVGSTPYESTETFDIKGLTFNNSGNVQIEVTCEKSGYITQKKRFGLRQVIDQKEISTKMNLIKDE